MWGPFSQDSAVVRGVGSGVRGPDLSSSTSLLGHPGLLLKLSLPQCPHLYDAARESLSPKPVLAVWPWVSDLTCLCLSFKTLI